ncbi:MAG TPA: anti-sigma factor [Candidatus Eremiobacteraceae bacterium]|nr:anti-sigma factor [Candidatus Eremiobacteraceae bacterium]
MIESDHVLDLTAAYALHSLPPDQRQAVETHCASCASCAADLAEMKGLAATLPLACEPMTPSAALKRRILAEARGEAAAGQALRNSQRRAAIPSSTPWWAGLAAAVFLAGVSLNVSAMIERSRMDAQAASSATQMKAMGDELALNKGAIIEIAGARKVWDMSGGKPDHWWHCTLVQPFGNKPAMLVASMPAMPKGKTFQVWVIRHGAVHNAGLVPAGKTSMMHMPMPVQKGDVVAFTVEPLGGSKTPTMPIAMSQSLD